MNLANKLTVLRLCLVPIFMAVMLIPESLLSFRIVCAIGFVLFIAASVTDTLDGNIARKKNMITDFGKFLDPLADKFMVIGALLVLFYRMDTLRFYLLIASTVVIFRELAVTAARLIASTSGGLVLAANKLGKLKTVCQIVFISAAMFETAVWQDRVTFLLGYPLTLLFMALTVVLTIVSGVVYIRQCWPYINSKK